MFRLFADDKHDRAPAINAKTVFVLFTYLTSYLTPADASRDNIVTRACFEAYDDTNPDYHHDYTLFCYSEGNSAVDFVNTLIDEGCVYYGEKDKDWIDSPCAEFNVISKTFGHGVYQITPNPQCELFYHRTYMNYDDWHNIHSVPISPRQCAVDFLNLHVQYGNKTVFDFRHDESKKLIQSLSIAAASLGGVSLFFSILACATHCGTAKRQAGENDYPAALPAQHDPNEKTSLLADKDEEKAQPQPPVDDNPPAYPDTCYSINSDDIVVSDRNNVRRSY